MCSFSLHYSCERAKLENEMFLSQHIECFYSLALDFSSPFLQWKKSSKVAVVVVVGSVFCCLRSESALSHLGLVSCWVPVD